MLGKVHGSTSAATRFEVVQRFFGMGGGSFRAFRVSALGFAFRALEPSNLAIGSRYLR